MKRAVAWPVAAAVVLAAVAAAAWFARPVAPPVAPATPALPAPSVQPSAPVSEVPPAAPEPQKMPVAPPPVPALPTGDDPASLLARARAGDPDAMLDIGTLLLPCGPDTAEKMLLRMEAGIPPALAGRDDATTAACERLPPEERLQGFAWIEKAAVAGQPAAQRAFLRHALDDYATPDSVIANIDEVERRRDLARRFVADMVRNCKPHAFALQRSAFNILGMDDRVERMAVLHAEHLSQPDPDQGSGDSAAQLEFARESEHADVAEVAEAERRGAAMHAHCAR